MVRYTKTIYISIMSDKSKKTKYKIYPDHWKAVEYIFSFIYNYDITLYHGWVASNLRKSMRNIYIPWTNLQDYWKRLRICSTMKAILHNTNFLQALSSTESPYADWMLITSAKYYISLTNLFHSYNYVIYVKIFAVFL